jgi:hypothetical protein
MIPAQFQLDPMYKITVLVLYPMTNEEKSQSLSPIDSSLSLQTIQLRSLIRLL